VLVFVGWRAGTFDSALVHVGLNAKPCVKNAYGATFCGSSATNYCESLPGGGSGVKMCEQIGAVSPAATLKQGQRSIEETEHTNEQQSQEAMQRSAEEDARILNERKEREGAGDARHLPLRIEQRLGPPVLGVIVCRNVARFGGNLPALSTAQEPAASFQRSANPA
jgi:hypothetical protein